MAQIFDPGPSFGERLGTALGTGLGSSLEQLAIRRLQGMQQRQLSSALQQAYPGLSPSLANVFSSLDPKIQQDVLRSVIGQQESNPLSQALEQVVGGQSAPQQISDQSLESLLAPIQQQRAQLSPAPQSVMEEPMGALAQNAETQKIKTPSVKRDTEEVVQKTQTPRKDLTPGARISQEQERLDTLLESPLLTASQKTKLRDQVEKRADRFQKQQDKIDKTTEKFYSKINDEGESAREGNVRLDKMLELVNSGKLSGPVTSAALETLEHGLFGIGLNLFGLTSKETQEFKKLQTDFLRDAKKVFGSRVTNDEVKRYLQRLPALTQSDEGKRQVIRDLKAFNDAALAKKSIMDDIINENEGYRPHNIEDIVNKRAEPILNKISERIKEPYVSPQQLGREQAARRNPLVGILKDVGSLF